MAQATKKSAKQPLPVAHLRRGLRESALFVVGAIAIYMMISLLSYDAGDPGWSFSGNTDRVTNTGGRFGAWFSSVFLVYFGYLAYLFPLLVAYAAWRLYRGRSGESAPDMRHTLFISIGFVLTVAAGCGIATLHFSAEPSALPANPGGILGDIVSNSLVASFSFVGTTLFLLALFLTGVSLFTGLSWLTLMDRVGRGVCEAAVRLRDRLADLREEHAERREAERRAVAPSAVGRRKLKKERTPPRSSRWSSRSSQVRGKERVVPLFRRPWRPATARFRPCRCSIRPRSRRTPSLPPRWKRCHARSN